MCDVSGVAVFCKGLIQAYLVKCR